MKNGNFVCVSPQPPTPPMGNAERFPCVPERGSDTQHTREFVIRLRPLADPVPVACRLRSALKRLLRGHKFRCVDVREVSPTEDRS